MKLMTLQRNWIPIVVTVVLAIAFVVPVAANEGNNKNQQCGYGYASVGHTDNESQQGENHESAQAEANDEPCGEEQAGNEAGENDDNGGSTGGGGEDKSKTTTTVSTQSSDKKSSDNGKSGSSGDGEGNKKGGGGD